MPPLSLLLLATPLFGLSLDLDPSVSSPAALQAMALGVPTGMSGVASGAAPGVGLGVGTTSVGLATGSFGLMTPLLLAQELEAAAGDTSEAEPAQAAQAEETGTPEGLTRAQIREQLQRRAELAKIHRILGISTWAAMTFTLVTGYIQYHNLYGSFAAREDTPCVQGTAVFGQGMCSGVPLPHLITSVMTAGLYTATFGLSLGMSDPRGTMDQGDGAFARRLRMHKRLRWAHLAGMILQMGLGIVVANADRFGLDRANDYRTLQALSTVHMAVGTATWLTMTWAGALYLDY